MPLILLGANAELRTVPMLRITQGSLLSASGAASVHGDVVNDGSVRGPDGLTDYLVFDGKVTGSGSYSGHVKGAGAHSPGNNSGTDPGSRYAVISSSGSLELAPGHVLELDLGGFVPGERMDAVVSTGVLTLGGPFRLRLVPGFTPVQGDVFEIIRAGTLRGGFAGYDVEAATLSGHLAWDFGEVAVSGRVTVSAAPPRLSARLEGGTWCSPGRGTPPWRVPRIPERRGARSAGRRVRTGRVPPRTRLTSA